MNIKECLIGGSVRSLVRGAGRGMLMLAVLVLLVAQARAAVEKPLPWDPAVERAAGRYPINGPVGGPLDTEFYPVMDNSPKVCTQPVAEYRIPECPQCGWNTSFSDLRICGRQACFKGLSFCHDMIFRYRLDTQVGVLYLVTWQEVVAGKSPLGLEFPRLVVDRSELVFGTGGQFVSQEYRSSAIPDNTNECPAEVFGLKADILEMQADAIIEEEIIIEEITSLADTATSGGSAEGSGGEGGTAGCSSCTGSDAPAGTMTEGLAWGPRVILDVGPFSEQERGVLAIDYEDSGPAPSTRPCLKYHGPPVSTGSVTPGSPISAINAPTTRVTVTDEPAGQTGYRIAFHPRDGAQYAPTPSVSYLITTPDGQPDAHSLRIVKIPAQGPAVTSDYVYDAASSTWTATRGNGLRRFVTRRDVTGNLTTFHRQLWDSANELVAESEEVYRSIQGRLRLERKVTDPLGFRLGITNTFDDSGRLVSSRDHRGSWRYQTYDSEGRIRQVWSGFGDYRWDGASLPNAQESRRIEYDYVSVGDMPASPERSARPRTITHYVRDQVVGRTWRIFQGNTEVTILAASASATPSTPENLCTTNWLYDTGPHAGRVMATRRANGTAAVWFTEPLPGGTRHIERSGALNPGATGPLQLVHHGEQVVTEVNALGRVISLSDEILRELDSAGVAQTAPGSSLTRTYDSLGRVVRTEFSDGTAEVTTYEDCCQVTRTTDRTGVVTVRTRDVLGQLVTEKEIRAEGTREQLFTRDGAGRVVQVGRRIGDGPVQVMQTREYDAAGRLSREARTGGPAFQLEYGDDAQGLWTRLSVLGGNTVRAESTTRFAFDGLRTRTEGSAAAPEAASRTVENGLLVVTRTVLDASGQPTAAWTRQTFDFLGRPVKKTHADQSVEFWNYDRLGHLTNHIDADGVSTVQTYNDLGQPELIVADGDRDGAVTLESAADRVSRITTSHVQATIAGRTAWWRKTVRSQLKTDYDDAFTDVATEHASLDGRHVIQDSAVGRSQVIQSMTADGGVVVQSIAPDGSAAWMTNRAGRPVGSAHFNAAGQLLASVTVLYDAHGRVSSIQDSRSGTRTLEYDAYNRLSAESVSPAGGGQSAQRTTYVRDELGQVIRVTHPDGSSTTNEYTATGRLLRTHGSGIEPREFGYDLQGRMVSMTTWKNFGLRQGAAVTTWSYDERRGWLTGQRYADGNGPDYTYTPGGRLKSRSWVRTESGGSRVTKTIRYGFDDPVAADGHGDAVGYSFNDGRTADVTYARDREGAVRSVRGTLGGTTVFERTYNYGAAGEVVLESHTAGPLAGVSMQWDYNASMQPTQVLLRNAAGTALHQVRYGYDPAGRLAMVASPHNPATGTAGDAAGYQFGVDPVQVASIRYTNLAALRLTTTRSYDRLSRLAAITSATPGALAPVTAFTYDLNALDQRVRVTQTDGSYWLYEYDRTGRLTSARKYWRDGARVAGMQFDYAFDDIGNRTEEVSGGDVSGQGRLATTHAFNALNEETTRVNPGVVDLSGLARVDQSVTVNGQAATRQGEFFRREVPVNNGAPGGAWASMAVQAGSAPAQSGRYYVPPQNESLTFDVDGNLTSDGRWMLSWDAENRLVGMETTPAAVAAGVPRESVTLTYDDSWRLLTRSVSNWVSGAWATVEEQRWIHDGARVFAQWRSTGAQAPVLDQTCVWGLDVAGGLETANGVGGLLWIRHRQTSQTHFVCHDGNGNVVRLINGADSSVSADYEYDPFGRLVRLTGPAAAMNPWRWSGKYQDSLTGWSHFGHRFYDPARGVWLNRDPLGEAGGANLFAYVGNSPVNRIDPDGRAWLLFDRDAWRQLAQDTLIGDTKYNLDPNSNVSQRAQEGMLIDPYVDENGRPVSMLEVASVGVAAGLNAATMLYMPGEELVASVGGRILGRLSQPVAEAFKKGYRGICSGERGPVKFTRIRKIIQLGDRQLLKNPNSPKYYGFNTPAGGEVWVSDSKVTQASFIDLVLNYDGPVTLLTGTHGTEWGGLSPERFFFNSDLQDWSHRRGQVRVLDVTKLSPRQIELVLQREGRIVLGWCYSERWSQLRGRLPRGRYSKLSGGWLK